MQLGAARQARRRGSGVDDLAAPLGEAIAVTPAVSTETRVVLADPDPYLAFLLELNVPGVRVSEAGSDEELRALLADETHLVIAEVGSVRARQVLALAERPKVIGITADANVSARDAGVDGLLRRPFVPTELTDAVRTALGLPAPPRATPHAPPRAHSFIGVARLAAVALAAVLEVWGAGLGPLRAIVLASAFAYATIRFVLKANGRTGAVADVAVAAIILALTGGPSSAYWPFGLVAAATAGVTLGSRAGAFAGLVISLGSVGEFIRGRPDPPSQTVAWFMIFALTGVIGGLAGRIWRLDAAESSPVLEEANRILSTLHHIARAVPGSLDLLTVVSAALEEVRDAVGAPAAAVLLEEAGTCRVVESFGLDDPEALAVSVGPGALSLAWLEGARLIQRDEMTPWNAAAVGDHECWLAAPLARGSARFGLLLAACPNHAQHHRNRLLLERLAEETAVAVENAQLFRDVKELSIDEERRRLAREIHDGVAQALMHVKLELDFLARHGSMNTETMQQETTRLARVVDRAIAEVRGMMLGLRASISDVGIAGALRSYLRDLRGLGGPEISFVCRGTIALGRDVEAEIFRIAQEALSNALRHAQASKIAVLLDAGQSGTILRIEDDGRGFWPRPDGNGGVGLGAMRERAERMGAKLAVTSRSGAGTQVELFCPAVSEKPAQGNGRAAAKAAEERSA